MDNFLTWLRAKLKIDKPSALPWDEWDVWYDELKTGRPIAHFFTESVPRALRRVSHKLFEPISNFKYRLYNRFVAKLHYLPTRLDKGKWYEYETRLLHGMFEAFVDFVEIDCASHHTAWNGGKEFQRPWWRNHYWLSWKQWRCPEAGVAYLHWCMTLDDPNEDHMNRHPPQAESARETFELYYWWKYIHPNRPEPFEASGVNAWYEAHPNTSLFGKKSDPEARKLLDACHQIAEKIEREYLEEDEAMMIRLVKHRAHLWT